MSSRRRLATRVDGWRKVISGLHTVVQGLARAVSSGAAACVPPYVARPNTPSRSYLAAASGSTGSPETLGLYVQNYQKCYTVIRG